MLVTRSHTHDWAVVQVTVPNSINPGFYQLNETQSYKVTIEAIHGDSVTLETDWVLQNGTDVSKQQTVNLSDGYKSDEYGFFFSLPF